MLRQRHADIRQTGRHIEQEAAGSWHFAMRMHSADLIKSVAYFSAQLIVMTFYAQIGHCQAAWLGSKLAKTIEPTMRAARRRSRRTKTTTITVALPAAVAFVLVHPRSEILHTIFLRFFLSFFNRIFSVRVCVCVGVQYAAINLQLSACQRFPSFVVVVVVVIDNTR